MLLRKNLMNLRPKSIDNPQGWGPTQRNWTQFRPCSLCLLPPFFFFIPSYSSLSPCSRQFIFAVDQIKRTNGMPTKQTGLVRSCSYFNLSKHKWHKYMQLYTIMKQKRKGTKSTELTCGPEKIYLDLGHRITVLVDDEYDHKSMHWKDWWKSPN